MYLTSTNLVHYLLASGHLTRGAVVHQPFSVLEIAGHHRSFRVTSGTGGLFVKQLKRLSDFNVACLDREASSYRLAWSDAKLAEWQQFLPRLIDYDRDRHVVIVQRVPGAETLTQCHRRLGSFPVDLARLVGTALAGFHNATCELPRGPDDPFQTSPPWIFLFHQQSRPDAAPAIKQLANVVSEDEAFSQQLVSLNDTWVPARLIHGDLKWSNCLVSPTTEEKPQLHLVDWEMASWGDPLWDVAGGMSNYLVEPISSRSHYAVPPSVSLEDAEFTEFVRAPMQSLWSTYSRHCNFAAADNNYHAVQCVRYVAARLLLTTFEYHQNSLEMGESFIPVLEMSRKCLNQPNEMAALLLGVGAD